MSAMNHLTTGQTHGRTGTILSHRLSRLAARWSEPFWLCISFLLFVVMGPFSVIAVLYGLWSLANGENREKMIEPASY